MSGINLRVATLRADAGMTQQELADRLGMSSQSVSKWETGAGLPDISILPVLAEIFHVSVDQLLGLKPLPREQYVPEETGKGSFWNQKLEYLLRTRKQYYNKEFLQYLIHGIWGLDEPVGILDCGCGYGFLGLLLLPLLPAGSTYTGIDYAGELIAYGRQEFRKKSMKAELIEQDFYHYETARKFDVVIAHAVLRHVDCAGSFLAKMISHAREGGLVISIEANREFECDGLYIDGMDYFDLCEHSGLTKKWKMEYERQGRDYAVAMRIPDMMRRAGLRDVDVRMNDKVEFVTPEKENYMEMKTDFVEYYDWNARLTEGEREQQIEDFVSKGMSRREAEHYCLRSERIREALQEDSASYLFFKGHMIAFGRK